MAVFKVDGMEFDVLITELKRKFTVTDTDNSGRTMDGKMHRDIIGTYYNYSITIKPKDTAASRADYDTMYEMLSAPVSHRTLVVPYAQTTKEFEAYITGGEDSLKKRNGNNIWTGLTLEFVAMEPQRRPS